jgi:hypothetical protein
MVDACYSWELANLQSRNIFLNDQSSLEKSSKTRIYFVSEFIYSNSEWLTVSDVESL